ncbi:MAG: hypothetical protein HZA62_13310 [Rhodocyclales bacterium]|nr:hypothetical protein [Rhodocyclales bacterium]
MRPVARGAGSRRRFLARAAALAGSVAAAGCGGVASPRGNAHTWLEPMFGLSGAILTDRVHSTGQPLPGGNEIYLSFMFPVAAVASQGALFVADAGHGKLFRYDRGSGLMAAVPGVRIAAGSKLDAGTDGSIYIMDAMGGEIRRHSMHGAPVLVMHPRLPSSRYLAFAMEAASGRVFAVDSVHKMVDRIEPGGRVALSYLELDRPGPIAIDGTALWVADAECGCVREWRNGGFVRRLASGKLRLPMGLVAERGEVYVLDGFDRSISRVFEGGLETVAPADLNLVSPQHIFVSNGIMYVADGASRSVAVFRIRRHPS